MLPLILFCTVYVIAVASARGGPIQQTERGSSSLVFLERHPRAGTHHSRARLARRSKQRIWRGLRLAGVYEPFMCIHRHESIDWHIWNPPYAGGMQEDQGFQATYGAEYIRAFGTPGHPAWANVWPPWAQVMAAYRAWHGYHGYGARGYTPWSTAGSCGL